MNYKQEQLKARLKEKAEKRAFVVLGNWFNEGNERRYVTDNLHLRLVGAAHDVVKSIRHNGWYADQYQDALIIGQVYRLPAKRGSTRYLAAYLESESDHVIVAPNLFDNDKDAALCADDMAQYAAEQSREFYAKDAAEQETERLQEEICEARKDCLALLREAKPLRKKGDSQSVLCRELGKSVKRYLSEIAKKRERIEALADNFWLAVEDF